MAILHVDDQEAVRAIVRRALQSFGVAVVSVDGVRAAKLAITARDDLTGAFLDVRLLDGSGVDLYEWIGVHRPLLAARVAFLTGDAESRASLATLDCPIIGKPFELGALRRFAAEWEAAAGQD
jgi:DNA-binding NtrC family response regulator